MEKVVTFLVNVLMIGICILGYICVILGAFYVIKIAMMEIFRIDITQWRK